MHEPCPECTSRLTRIHCGNVTCAWLVCEACGFVWDGVATTLRGFTDPRLKVKGKR